jgi:hypothetical protein
MEERRKALALAPGSTQQAFDPVMTQNLSY